ncbi:hypothetical protein AB6A23_00990 [Paenibacillus tarimensis]
MPTAVSIHEINTKSVPTNRYAFCIAAINRGGNIRFEIDFGSKKAHDYVTVIMRFMKWEIPIIKSIRIRMDYVHR